MTRPNATLPWDNLNKISKEDVLHAFRTADKTNFDNNNDDGRLNGGLHDSLPALSIKGNDGIVFISPEVQRNYNLIFHGQSTAFTDAVIKSSVFLKRNTLKGELSPEEISEMIQKNSGYPIKLEDVAKIYPNAKLNGNGKTLSELSKINLNSKKYPSGISLGKAYLDAGGELIVSHIYEFELKERAPNVAQFVVPTAENLTQKEAHIDAQLAFEKADADSYPLDIDTMLAFGSLSLNSSHWVPLAESLASEFKLSESDKRKIEKNGSYYFSHPSLPGVKLQKVWVKPNLFCPLELQTNLIIDLKNEEQLKKLLLHLEKNYRIPCNPEDLEQLKYLSSLNDAVPNKHFRRAVAALFNQLNASLNYRQQDANHPEKFHKVAKKPSLHFLARINPEDTNQVFFAIEHIDAQSWPPRGDANHKQILPATLSDTSSEEFLKYKHERMKEYGPQHQGEIEPIYFRFSRHSNFLELKQIYLGQHLIAVPFDKSDIENYSKFDGNDIWSGNKPLELSVAYQSGGRMLLPENTEHHPEPIYEFGAVSGPGADWTKFLFNYTGAYPGRSNLGKHSGSAVLLIPEGSVGDTSQRTLNYQIIIEAKNNNFAPTANYLFNNGAAGDVTSNTSGFPFTRGVAQFGNDVRTKRTMVSIKAFLDNQDKLKDRHQMGSQRNIRVGTEFATHHTDHVKGDTLKELGPNNALFKAEYSEDPILYNLALNPDLAAFVGLDVYWPSTKNSLTPPSMTLLAGDNLFRTNVNLARLWLGAQLWRFTLELKSNFGLAAGYEMRPDRAENLFHGLSPFVGAEANLIFLMPWGLKLRAGVGARSTGVWTVCDPANNAYFLNEAFVHGDFGITF